MSVADIEADENSLFTGEMPTLYSKPGLLFFFNTATFTEARMLSFQLPGDGQNTPIGFKDALMQF
jgi:hypothetical protein